MRFFRHLSIETPKRGGVIPPALRRLTPLVAFFRSTLRNAFDNIIILYNNYIMDLNEFSSFGDKSQLWVYIFDRELDESEASDLTKRMTEFIGKWTSHGNELEGNYLVYQNQIVLIALEEGSAYSGCAIDNSVRVFKDFSYSCKADALDRKLIFFLSEKKKIQGVSRSEFANLLSKGIVNKDTTVIDSTISTLGDLRRGGLFKPLNQSWHKKISPSPILAS